MEFWLISLLIYIALFVAIFVGPLGFVIGVFAGKKWGMAYSACLFLLCWWHLIPGYLYFQHLCRSDGGIKVISKLPEVPDGHEVSSASGRIQLAEALLGGHIARFDDDRTRYYLLFGAIRVNERIFYYDGAIFARRSNYVFLPINLDDAGIFGSFSFFEITNTPVCSKMESQKEKFIWKNYMEGIFSAP